MNADTKYNVNYIMRVRVMFQVAHPWTHGRTHLRTAKWNGQYWLTGEIHEQIFPLHAIIHHDRAIALRCK